MIRGSIESVTGDSIEGWIFSEDGRIRERTILAFQDDVCIGAGKVNTFRADLADAGIGDGHLGFSFPISAQGAQTGSVFVKIEGSDALILQRSARIAASGDTAEEGLDRSALRVRLAGLKWALKHGRISQSDFDFLRILWSFGVYERGLARRVPGEEGLVMDRPETVAAHLFESYLELDAELVQTPIVDAAAFAAEMRRVAGGKEAAPLLALHSDTRAVLRVREGSHLSGASGEGAPGAFSDTVLTPENLVMLDARASAELVVPAGARVLAISAAPAIA